MTAQLIPSTTPVRALEDHEQRVIAVAAFPYTQRMVTGSYDKIIRLWDMRKGVVLKKMEGHRATVYALALSRDGKLIASGDANGGLIAWDGDTGEPLTQTISAHSTSILSLDFAPDGRVLAVGSNNHTMKLWSTATWQQQGDPISCGANVRCVRYSPSGKHLAIATDDNIQIYNPGARDCIANFKGHASEATGAINWSLVWTPDSARLFSAGFGDPTIQEWDSSSWQRVGAWNSDHFDGIRAISLNSKGTLLASASHDKHVRLCRLSDRRTIAIFRHSHEVNCVTFSADDKYILSGGDDMKISEWPVSEDALPEDGTKDGLMKVQGTHQAQAYPDFKVLAMNLVARNACIAGDLPTAEKVLSQEIGADANNHASYANRAFVMARKGDWDHALHDAIQSVSIQPSLAGHIAKGIALCGKKQVRAARTAFDFASMFTDGDVKTNHFMFLIETIALFNAKEHEEAMERVEELAVCPNVDPLACRIVEAYLRVQLGNIALKTARYNEAVDHFTAAVNASSFFYKLEIHSMYEGFIVLFGWDLKSLWQTTNQQQCHALFRAGRIGAAVETYQSVMDKSDATTKARLRAWFAALK